MAARGAAQMLPERIDDEAAYQPSTIMMDESSRSMAEHIIQTMTDRFERRLTEGISPVDRRLTEEISSVRVDMQEIRVEIREIRLEMHNGFSELRAEMAVGREKATRWAIFLWTGQIGAIGGLLAYLK